MTEAYSSLNTYQYSEKTEINKALDFFSAPLRIALGGRKVSLIVKTYQYEESSRIERIFFVTM